MSVAFFPATHHIAQRVTLKPRARGRLVV